MPGKPIRVLCVDDHAVVREGLATIINKHKDTKVVGFAADGAAAVSQFRLLRPDVTLMDLRMPGMNGFEAIRAIRAEDPHARIIVLTMYQGDEDIHRALVAGAAAYLLKDMLAENVVERIREVHTASGLAAGAAETARRRGDVLSEREVEVLEWLATGLRNKEIGAKLGISEGTVDTHVKKIYAKLDVHDRTGALNVAIRRGILHVGDD